MIYYDLMAFQLIFHSTQAIRRVSEVASFPHKLLLAIKYLFSSVEPTLAMFFVRCIQATHRKRHPQDGPNPRAKASGERWSGDMSAERDWDTVASVALAPAGAAGFAACALPLSRCALHSVGSLSAPVAATLSWPTSSARDGFVRCRRRRCWPLSGQAEAIAAVGTS